MPIECPWASRLPVLHVWCTGLCLQITPLHRPLPHLARWGRLWPENASHCIVLVQFLISTVQRGVSSQEAHGLLKPPGFFKCDFVWPELPHPFLFSGDPIVFGPLLLPLSFFLPPLFPLAPPAPLHFQVCNISLSILVLDHPGHYNLFSLHNMFSTI